MQVEGDDVLIGLSAQLQSNSFKNRLRRLVLACCYWLDSVGVGVGVVVVGVDVHGGNR